MSYDPTLPTNRDWVRFTVGDVNTTSEKVTDSEIDAILVQYPVKECAAVRVLEAIIARSGSGASTARNLKSKSVDGISVSYDNLGNAAAMTDLLKRLRKECARRSNSGTPIFEVMGTHTLTRSERESG